MLTSILIAVAIFYVFLLLCYLDAQLTQLAFTVVHSGEIVIVVRKEWKRKTAGATNLNVTRARGQVVKFLANIKDKDIDAETGEVKNPPAGSDGKRTRSFFEVWAFGITFMGFPGLVERYVFANMRPKLKEAKKPKADGTGEYVVYEITNRDEEDPINSLYFQTEWAFYIEAAETSDKFPLTLLFEITFRVVKTYEVLFNTSNITRKLQTFVSDILRTKIGQSSLDDITRGHYIENPGTPEKKKNLVDIVTEKLQEGSTPDFLGMFAVRVAFRQYEIVGDKAKEIQDAIIGPATARLRTQVAEQEAQQIKVKGNAQAEVDEKLNRAKAADFQRRMDASEGKEQLAATIALAEAIGDHQGTLVLDGGKIFGTVPLDNTSGSKSPSTTPPTT